MSNNQDTLGKETTVKKHTIKAVISKGDQGYVAECLDLPVVTQGSSLDQTIANLREALTLALEGEDLEELGLAPHPALIITMELEPVDV